PAGCHPRTIFCVPVSCCWPRSAGRHDPSVEEQEVIQRRWGPAQPLLSNVSEPRTSSMRPSFLWRRAFASAAVALVALSANSQEAEEPVIEAGKTVKFEYTLSLD